MLNFTVGPVQMDDDIRAIGAEQIPYFRTAEFSALMKENEQWVLECFHAPAGSRAIFLTGSGTSAMESAVINSFDRNDKLLVVNGGSFGARFVEICEIHGIPHEVIALPYGKALTAADLERYDGAGFTGFLINLHETSTGVLYDADLVGDFCRRNNLFLIMDCISAFLADDFDMAAVGANIALTGSQKALALAPGVAVVVLDEKAVRRVTEKKTAVLYLNYADHLKNMERGQTPFTPAVATLIQMHARLRGIVGRGVAAETARIRALAQDFRSKIVKLGFTFFAESMSNAVTALRVAEGLSAHHIFEILKDEYGIFVCPNGGELRDSVFRVGHIGALRTEDNDTLIAALTDMRERGLL